MGANSGCLCVRKEANQSINQSLDHPVSQSTCLPISTTATGEDQRRSLGRAGRSQVGSALSNHRIIPFSNVSNPLHICSSIFRRMRLGMMANALQGLVSDSSDKSFYFVKFWISTCKGRKDGGGEKAKREEKNNNKKKGQENASPCSRCAVWIRDAGICLA